MKILKLSIYIFYYKYEFNIIKTNIEYYDIIKLCKLKSYYYVKYKVKNYHYNSYFDKDNSLKNYRDKFSYLFGIYDRYMTELDKEVTYRDKDGKQIFVSINKFEKACYLFLKSNIELFT